MKNLIMASVVLILIALIVLLSFFDIDLSSFSPNIEWATTFILPWLVLFWFIRLVKSFENK